MAIQCQKCMYHMSQAEAFGYMTTEVYKLFKDVIVPCLLQFYTKRGIKDSLNDMIEQLIIGVLNKSQTECHICMKYHGWSQNISSIINIKSEINQKDIL